MGKREDKFSEDGMSDEVSGIRVRHINRNEDKSRERTTPDSRRGSLTRITAEMSDNKPGHDSHVSKDGNSRPDFFVLILSKKHAKLFRGDLSGLKHIEIDELPNGIDDVVNIPEKDQKENIVLYLKEVDRTLWTSGLNKSNIPLVLGGVEYIVAIYKEISQYKHILEKCVCGSIENEDPKVIYRKAKEIVNPTFAG